MTDLPQLTIICPACHQPYTRSEVVEQSAEGPRIEFYRCETCVAGKLAVLFELDAAHAPPAPGFVEREIARHGAFFPSSGGLGRFGGDRGPRNW